MARKGQSFREYSPDLKMEAIRVYEEGGISYRSVAEKLGILNCSQVKQWVKKHRNGEALNDNRKITRKNSSRKGRPKVRFASVEEERDYLKAEVEYLKKRYPNLHEE